MAENNAFISSVAEDAETTELSHAVGEERERGPLIRRRFWQFLTKGNPHPPCNPAIPLPGVRRGTGTVCSQGSRHWDSTPLSRQEEPTAGTATAGTSLRGITLRRPTMKDYLLHDAIHRAFLKR